MERPHNKERIVMMYQMLFEMARGNFNSHIPASAFDDELETLVVLINMVAEEMRDALFPAGYVNRHRTDRLARQNTFILDAALQIVDLSPEAASFLGYPEDALPGGSLPDIISGTSLVQLHKVLAENLPMPASVTLDFTRNGQLPTSVSCTIGRLYNRPEFLLNLATPAHTDYYNPMGYAGENEPMNKTRKKDAQLIQKLYDYILAHLEEPLPPLKVQIPVILTTRFQFKVST